VIIKTLAELGQPDPTSLAFRPLDIDPANLADGANEYRQSLVASFELLDNVPEITRTSYDRIRTTYAYGILCYELYTVAGNQARLVLEQALRDRFLPFYDGTVIFLDKKGQEHPVTTDKFADLYGPDARLVKGGWRHLKLRNEREPIEFNGMLRSLLRWAREEGLLGGQRDRWQDKFRVLFRNYTAHSGFLSDMPDDATTEIFHLANLINQLWGAPDGIPICRVPVAIAWTPTTITYAPADIFELGDRMPDDATCVVVMADVRDLTLGNSFDAQYQTTARPCDFLWGPGAWSEAAQWLKRTQPVGDEVPTVDRLFLLRYDGNRLYMPHDIRVAAGLGDDQQAGVWYLIRADHPRDAMAHQQQVLLKTQGHSSVGFCNECPAESIASGTWRDMIGYCATIGADVAPRSVPDLRSPFCRTPRWLELNDGRWGAPVLSQI